jgi:hypothetical protein
MSKKLTSAACISALIGAGLMAAPASAATLLASTGTTLSLTSPSQDAQSFGDGADSDGGAYYYTFSTDANYKVAIVDAGTLEASYVDNPFTLESGATPGSGAVEGASALGSFAEGLTTILPAGTYTVYIPSTTPNEALTGSVSVAGVPEPAVWAMMLVGMGMIGGVLRRRSNPVSLAA